ncbi:pyridoxamine 5'-phosphate oxidase family protein [Streptomyces sp. SL13]|uniref:Pyridoxamine 5'-phosphate oxidase family protein n=1 Tax=Streptantibioticus silvisoli TaxID=2705255 RepID=A0AA90H871_9ACTN|nr:pyridoxamine 5'-phosphate oxidase family protein [Streptantibioticus silvisoli]MDI5970625.1 pyridoxamine 5'-phosphate oxidase family protein [Streptantibioticus silvisoli]
MAHSKQAEPVTELDARYSDPRARPADWVRARDRLRAAEVFWLSTVRPDGRPHVTPLISVWVDDALYFCTGPDERKARNLAANPHVVMTTGANDYGSGFDLTVEGDAVNITDHARLVRIAGAYEDKYGAGWHYDVHDGAFVLPAAGRAPGHGRALVYEVAPVTAFGFGKGEFSQTRWHFNGDVT